MFVEVVWGVSGGVSEVSGGCLGGVWGLSVGVSGSG